MAGIGTIGRVEHWRVPETALERFGAALTVTRLVVQASYGGWQDTEWEMIPKKVVSASGRKANFLDSPMEIAPGLVEYVTASYKAGQFSFEVSFPFTGDNNILEHVVVTLKNHDTAAQLYGSLFRKYGEPVRQSIQPIQGGVSHTASWHDKPKNNQIGLVNLTKIGR